MSCRNVTRAQPVDLPAGGVVAAGRDRQHDPGGVGRVAVGAAVGEAAVGALARVQVVESLRDPGRDSGRGRGGRISGMTRASSRAPRYVLVTVPPRSAGSTRVGSRSRAYCSSQPCPRAATGERRSLTGAAARHLVVSHWETFVPRPGSPGLRLWPIRLGRPFRTSPTARVEPIREAGSDKRQRGAR